MIELITTAFTNLGYNANDIKIISHSESFVYYVLNQEKIFGLIRFTSLILTEMIFPAESLML